MTARTHTIAPALRAFCLAALLALAALLPAPSRQALADAITYADVSGQTAQPYAYTEEGVGGTRVVTPYYAVFLEDAQFPYGFAYEYTESMDGAYGVLDVYVAESRTDGDASAGVSGVPGQPTYRLYCVADGASTTPFAGTYATAEYCSDGTVVVVARPYGTGFSAEGEGAAGARALLSAGAEAEASDVAAGTEDCAAAQDLAIDMRNHVSGDTSTRTVANADGSTSIVTPWYTVTVPYGLFPDGWYYDYSDEMYDWSGDGSGAYVGRTLSVYAVGRGYVFSVYCGRGAGPQGEYVETTVAEFDGDWAGWRVGVYKYADCSSNSLEEELALLAPYAALVAPTDDPGANPPSLP